ncbi:MAG: hypothetical protein JWQ90_5568 [Hydrocarboniphaga sp.]|uniref:hypothetical protein n=1 Tax=Hydrocarboniphaga sp. TaxID=2033016 RepID=UPI00261C92DF|nr:hypothetical protein [Hydrocarboniphaga sp.]MDB5973118.1 hypothetical protein [Hydrocarboniphaga sp.]
MGPKSESFCRQTLSLMVQNPSMIPASLDVNEAQNDLTHLEALRPRFSPLGVLMRKATDSETALGSDVMWAATRGYRQLQINGKGEGLDDLLAEISVRFQRKKKVRSPPPEGSGS